MFNEHLRDKKQVRIEELEAEVFDLKRLVWLLLHKAGDVVVITDQEAVDMPEGATFEVIQEPETFSTIYATPEARKG